ncbi:nucleoside-diphosphate sugar epimerase [Sporosarcina sp. P19]|uniref:NAD-dependent epimerase/dehydratase family protein n=1 Tax=Sporosarcina sp. P19 TaxID=2048258 RepID=UPI000C171460|nr:NAD(P)-dependent oxidoreductase [Sporosarcina sp. P19]PIC77127.1 nucleoside-diphosphate sugar epimerase [Sporosarcina sp. P19]
MIVVIGATGFIGLYTVEKLIKSGYKVMATGNKNKIAGEYLESIGAKYIHFDMTDENDINKLPKEDVEGVILLGGLLPANAKVNLDKDENAADYIKINTLGTINILEYCRKNRVKKLISTTTYSDVFKSWKKDIALKETEPRNFSLQGDHAAYAISKNASTDLIEYYSQQHGLSGAVFRLPPVYGIGPHDIIYDNGISKKSGITIFIEKAMKGEPIEVHGDPNLSRDIIYVKDVADAFVKAMKSDKTQGLYNMTSGVSLTLENQIKTVIDVFSDNEKSEILYRPEIKNSTPSYLFDMTKAKHDFDFVPEFSNYKKMMEDYKIEMESGRFNFFIKSRKKS